MTLKEKLVEIQSEIKVPKNKTNDFGNFKYRSAEDILKALKPYENKYKVLLTLNDEIATRGNANYVEAIATILNLMIHCKQRHTRRNQIRQRLRWMTARQQVPALHTRENTP